MTTKYFRGGGNSHGWTVRLQGESCENLSQDGCSSWKTESFCVLREEGGYHFTTSSHAFQLIPLIRKGEEETIKSEISTFNVAVTFLWHNKAWGSSGNSAQVCYSWLENQMSPSLASVTCEVTLSKQEEIITVLADQYNVTTCSLLATIGYSALANAASMRTMRIIVPKVIMLFFPHYWSSWTAVQGIRHQGGGSGGGWHSK